jgi:8-oxo-dGTP pyrophosphatase MutT (NUDIX family)
MMNSSVIIIIFNDQRDQVLLIKRRDVPVWVLPGGGVDDGEQPEDAAIRESFEETGLTVTIAKHVAEYTPLNRLAKLTNLYECIPVGGKLSTGSETKDVAYFPLAELPKTLFFLHRIWLQEALEAKEGLIRRPIYEVTYWNLVKYFCLHPKDTFRFALSRLGVPLNT